MYCANANILVVPRFCNMLPLGKTAQSVHGNLSVTVPCVNLQLSPNKKLNFKKETQSSSSCNIEVDINIRSKAVLELPLSCRFHKGLPVHVTHLGSVSQILPFGLSCIVGGETFTGELFTISDGFGEDPRRAYLQGCLKLGEKQRQTQDFMLEVFRNN